MTYTSSGNNAGKHKTWNEGQLDEVGRRAANGESHAALGREFGVSAPTIKYHAKKWAAAHLDEAAERQRLAQADAEQAELPPTPSDSLRSRVLEAVRRQGRFDTLRELQRAVTNGRQVGDHELIHILFSLSKQNELKFKEQMAGTQKVLYDIRVTGRVKQPIRPARRLRSGPVEHVRAVVPGVTVISAEGATTGDVMSDDSIRVEPTGLIPTESNDPAPTWPELQALQERRAQMAASNERASSYLAAAAALETVDPEESKRLEGKAVAIVGVGLSNLELEYLRYAGLHRK